MFGPLKDLRILLEQRMSELVAKDAAQVRFCLMELRTLLEQHTSELVAKDAA